ncbi:nuclear transport factor 2 family protein [Streptomyces sp. NPDC049040]|uniref:nuclear transport factor 2 family protein n=1 Tax=Streptomyces sp. NPDC049040 TaxID=3365593 RepID=UPI00372488F1
MTRTETLAGRGPQDVLDRYYQAMLDKSADDLADLYAADAVHEFPFSTPGFPPRFEGREAVRSGYRAAWGASPAQVSEIRRVAVHRTADPEVIIAEQVVVGTVPAADAAFTVPGLLVLRVRGGLISEVRDYIDSSGVSSARA